MSFNKRTISKRGGRFKGNLGDNVGTRRSNPDSNVVSYAAQLRPNKSLNMENNNISNMPNFYDDQTTLYLLCKYYLGNFISVKTEIEEFNGVLKAVSPNGDFCLTEATVFAHNVEFISKNEKFKMIPIKDIKIVEVKNADSDLSAYSANTDKILTDAEISKLHRSRNGGDRDYDENGCQEVELTPFYDSSVACDDNCLNANKIGAHWFPPEEMFEKNKMRFNVQSSYSEDLEGYTTKLHKEDPNFQKHLMIAQMKAQEIEKDRDHNFNDLENDDEGNEELLFSSVPRATESPHRVTSTYSNKINPKQMFPHHLHKNIELDTLKSPLQESNDPKHNLNPNALEFTPTSSSVGPYDLNSASIQIGSINLQPQAPFSGFIHPSNLMPYPMPLMFPPHHPTHMPMIHNNSIDQYLIQRPSFMPNYPMAPFLIPNQCQIAFDPNMIASSNKYEHNYPTVVFSSANDTTTFDRENGQHDDHNQLEISEINEEGRKDESETMKKYNEEVRRVRGVEEEDIISSAASDQNYENNLDYSMSYSSAMKIAPMQAQARMYPQAYIFPSNAAIRYPPPLPPPQMIPGHYIPNYFSRQGPLVHQMLPPGMIATNGNGGPQMQQALSMPFAMKPGMSVAGNNAGHFVPLIGGGGGGGGGHPLPGVGGSQGYAPSYGPPLSIHPQFSQFLSPMQPCSYFAPMPAPQQQAPPPHSQQP